MGHFGTSPLPPPPPQLTANLSPMSPMSHIPRSKNGTCPTCPIPVNRLWWAALQRTIGNRESPSSLLRLLHHLRQLLRQLRGEADEHLLHLAVLADHHRLRDAFYAVRLADLSISIQHHRHRQLCLRYKLLNILGVFLHVHGKHVNVISFFRLIHLVQVRQRHLARPAPRRPEV